MTKKTTVVSRLVVKTSAGTTIPLTQTTHTEEHFSKVRNLNARINIMDFFEAQEQICKSSKDITILKEMLLWSSKSAIFNNITGFATKYSHPTATVNRLLKRARDVGLFAKVRRGEYMVNPYTITPTWLRGKDLESLQSEWDRLPHR